ncbi:Na+/H+ antiporter [Dyadobacter sp. CY351]|uniref:Na+/H+ antiporter n=1 Tax=Dyadobacter sp. CY351 TaxID=2909337 RepID=UPI001F1C0388|nr:Na+/H+ antiporter [Dyadobacter sp. CY351]MCF2518800.1 Na+/H+ antiporter [Dyadobacter sp. CY351]
METDIIIYVSLVLMVAFLVLIARKLSIAYPILLVVTGLALSFIPGIPNVRIDPDTVFLIILPPILFDAAQQYSWRALWKWRRMVSVMALGYVLLTSTLVAIVSCWLIPGFTMAQGFLLGAIISPPDAAAATAILKKVKLPKGLISILEGESLLNDAASLTIFRFALAAVVSNQFVWYEALGTFALITVSGVAIGVAIGMLFYALYKWLPTTSNLDVTFLLVLPYLNYIVAEELGSSGVIAVVTAGLLLSSQTHFVLPHSSRLKSNAILPSITFILNAIVFFLIGIQFPGIMKGLKDISLSEALKIALVIAVLIMLVRLAAGHISGIFTSFISKYIKVAVPHPGWRNPMIISWIGMRGVVSLASALSIPLVIPGGAEFPFRSLILFITYIVIIVTLVGQGLTLPWVIKKIKPEKIPGEVEDHDQLMAIEKYLFNAAHDKLDSRYAKDALENRMIQHKLDLMAFKVGVYEGLDDAEQKEKVQAMVRHFNKVMMEVLEHERRHLIHFCRRDEFDDDVIRIMERRLDLKEETLEDNL